MSRKLLFVGPRAHKPMCLTRWVLVMIMVMMAMILMMITIIVQALRVVAPSKVPTLVQARVDSKAAVAFVKAARVRWARPQWLAAAAAVAAAVGVAAWTCPEKLARQTHDLLLAKTQRRCAPSQAKARH
mmetsp:Transcript_19837/g.42811  ORF Transcript_19837/g.42811 Transcript_19837/m.42811 type:complete len:129 (+) Transcript_19837:1730-2116(+)